jgi:hypothetical protein
MKRSKALLVAAVFAVTSVAGTSAWADRDHHDGDREYRHSAPFPRHEHRDHRAFGLGAGLVLGSALLWAATRPPTVIYQEPAPVVVAPPPPVYMAPPPPADGWWYYCRASGTYYPYVQSCPGRWERVAPQ